MRPPTDVLDEEEMRLPPPDMCKEEMRPPTIEHHADYIGCWALKAAKKNELPKGMMQGTPELVKLT